MVCGNVHYPPIGVQSASAARFASVSGTLPPGPTAANPRGIDLFLLPVVSKKVISSLVRATLPPRPLLSTSHESVRLGHAGMYLVKEEPQGAAHRFGLGHALFAVVQPDQAD